MKKVVFASLVGMVCLSIVAGEPGPSGRDVPGRSRPTEGPAPLVARAWNAGAMRTASGSPSVPRPAPRTLDERFALAEPRPLDIRYVGPAELVSTLDHDLVRATALTASDLDGDGATDVVAGYADGKTGLLTVLRGDATLRSARGKANRSPLLPTATVHRVPIVPDLLVSGDFDNDGRWDVAAAALGGRELCLLPGDGTGGFGTPRCMELPGGVTAMIAGDINRRDGLADLVIGEAAPDGPVVVILEGPDGAWAASPERVVLDAPATGLALGELDGDDRIDLVVASGTEVRIVHGRDRWLTVDPEFAPVVVEPPSCIGHDLGALVQAVAVGDFAWESRRRLEVAALLDDGTLRVFAPGGASMESAGRAATGGGGWSEIATLHVGPPLSAGRETERLLLVPTRLTRTTMDDLLVVDPAAARMHVVTGLTRGDRDAGQIVSEDLAATPRAVLSARLDGDAARDLVLLNDASSRPELLTSAPDSVIVVNSAVDFPAPPAGDGLCTLREALLNANSDSDVTAGDCAAGSGIDAIDFNVAGGGAPATIVLRAPLPDVSDPAVIDGTTQGCANPPCVALTGQLAGAANGLRLTADGSTIRGLVIELFGAAGVSISSSDNIVEGCIIGLDPTGTTAAGNGAEGVLIDGGSGNVIGGSMPGSRNVISANEYGVRIIGAGSDNQVIGNYVGTAADGTVPGAAIGNAVNGIRVDGSPMNVLGGTASGEGNLVSGNLVEGIITDGAATGNLIQGNTIGLDIHDAPAGNAGGGFVVQTDGNTVGGTAVGARNVMSSNTYAGVAVANLGTAGTPRFNVIQGNYVGTDSTGTLARPNSAGAGGITVWESDDNLVGGNVPAARNIAGSDETACIWIWGHNNVVQGNYAGTDVNGTLALTPNVASVTLNAGGTDPASAAIDTAVLDNVIAGGNFASLLLQLLTQGSIVQGNLIGTDATGTIALGSTNNGVSLFGVDNVGNTIGGSAPGQGNVIAGHSGSGISMTDSASGNTIVGNRIGTDIAGSPLPNLGAGITLADVSTNTIGGPSPGDGNVVSSNAGPGIVVTGAAALNNDILGNEIVDNGGLGVDLADDGVTANDTMDADGGPNGLQNFPEIATAETGLSYTTITGTLDSTPATAVRVEFFSSAACDASGYGEGGRYLGFTDVTTDASGGAVFSATVLGPASAGEAVTATATGSAGSSEFSACVEATACTLTPFGPSVLVADPTQLSWGVAMDVLWVKGPLAGVSSYATSADGALAAATALDVSADTPGPGTGLWYLVRPLACGSWQTALGAEPGRDGGALP